MLLYNHIVLKIEKLKQSERYRQHHRKKTFKTLVKQQLDREVNLSLARCKNDSLNLVVENPKTLANLRSLHRWARSYFANRATERALEEDVYTIWIHPAYTSITCFKCGHIDKRSRVNQSLFKCTECGNTLNADVNAAFNITLKGQERLAKQVDKAPVNIEKCSFNMGLKQEVLHG